MLAFMAVRGEDTSDTDLEEYFGKHGKVVGVSQERATNSGKKKGSGYIEFSDKDPSSLPYSRWRGT